MLADRQTDRPTDRHTHHNTIAAAPPGEVKYIRKKNNTLTN